MREIKFRAWDKKNKWMDFDIFVGKHGIYERASKTYDTPNLEIEGSDDFELMQFTGLRDKNGKEIYEGDIIELGVPMKMEVIYTRCYFAIKINENQSMILTGLESSSQVIGNIYENPGLLK